MSFDEAVLGGADYPGLLLTILLASRGVKIVTLPRLT
jgi:hypothetical protein